MQTIVITGGGGFIGSNIAAALARENRYRVVVCDRFRAADKWRNLRGHAVNEVVTPEDLPYWLELRGEEVEAIIHMGAVSSTTERDVDHILQNNFGLSTVLWGWCAQYGKRFIYASSAAVYGDGRQGFDDDLSPEYMAKLRPLNPYGWSKLLFDRYALTKVLAGQEVPPQWAALRFFNVYGPNEYHKEAQKSVIANLTPHAAHGQAVKLFKSLNPRYADGGQQRDFIYVRDCVSVVRWLLDNPQVSGLFNVGTGQARSYAELAAAIFDALGREPNISYIDMPAEIASHYQYFTQAKTERLRGAGYAAPFTSLEEGVRDYVQRYLSQDDPYL